MIHQPNNLNTFRILFLVKGVLTLCLSLFFIIYASIGYIIGAVIENNETNTQLPFNFGWIFIIIGGLGMLFCITLGVLTLLLATINQKLSK